jgi:hypothetical protein
MYSHNVIVPLPVIKSKPLRILFAAFNLNPLVLGDAFRGVRRRRAGVGAREAASPVPVSDGELDAQSGLHFASCTTEHVMYGSCAATYVFVRLDFISRCKCILKITSVAFSDL